MNYTHEYYINGGKELVNKEIIHVEEPNLYEDIFEFDNVPRIPFDGKIYEEINGNLVEFDPQEAINRELVITDTTFRDGQQARPPYTVEQTVDLYKLISKLGGPNGVIRWTEFFLYNNKDKEAVEKCLETGLEFPLVTGWVRANKGEFRLVTDMGLKETGMLTSCSDYHIFYKLRSDRKKILESYLDMVDHAISSGVRVRCHLEDVTRADIDGFVIPFVQKVMDMADQVDEDLKPKIRLCDTLGFGISYPGAALPRSIPKLVYKMIHEGGVPQDRLEWHGHNDFHKVHTNGAIAWLYGCNAVNTTLFGFGERTGNPPLEGAVIEYMGLKGTDNGMDTRVITEIAEYYIENIGAEIPHFYPLVGKNFNTTRAGIHADGLAKYEHVYNIFNTGKLLNRPPRVAITDKSGVDGVALWVNNYLGLTDEEKASKSAVARIARWVRNQYDVEGRNTAISDEEMEEQTRKYLPEHFEDK
ncbi:2-isopropylmalate synthase [Candidatus Poribacteria bacterium]|nr:2-isopropylmalate synthase [Candidatus Poribacteria bacterium]